MPPSVVVSCNVLSHRSLPLTLPLSQVTGWGFKRRLQGPQANSYFHPSFTRGRPDLVKEMRRPKKREQGSNVGEKPVFLLQSNVASERVTAPVSSTLSTISQEGDRKPISSTSTTTQNVFSDQPEKGTSLAKWSTNDSSSTLLSLDGSQFSEKSSSPATGANRCLSSETSPAPLRDFSFSEPSPSYAAGFMSGEDSDEEFHTLFASASAHLAPLLPYSLESASTETRLVPKRADLKEATEKHLVIPATVVKHPGPFT